MNDTAARLITVVLIFMALGCCVTGVFFYASFPVFREQLSYLVPPDIAIITPELLRAFPVMLLAMVWGIGALFTAAAFIAWRFFGQQPLKRSNDEQDAAIDELQEAMLQNCLNQLTEQLALHENVAVSNLQGLILTTLPSLDGGRKGSLVNFLCDGGLFSHGVDLRNADLREADLSALNLSGVDFTNADLDHADLRDADLTNAIISNEQLARTFSAETRSLQ